VSEAFVFEEPLASEARAVIVHVPHAATAIPPEAREGILLDDGELTEELRVMTDHATDRLSDGVTSLGAYRFVNRLSRLVIDPERFTDGSEQMEQVGMGAVYTRTSEGRPLRDPDDAEREALLERWFRPYTDALATAVSQVVDRHGACTLIDLHSYPAEALPYELAPTEPRPPVCIGTDDFHTPGWLVDLVSGACARHGFGWELDVPFAGTYTPLWAYGKDARVRSVMLEIRRDLYIDEATATPHDGFGQVEGFIEEVVHAAAERS
jgi:N-formylglutamate amidohydrolase